MAQGNIVTLKAIWLNQSDVMASVWGHDIDYAFGERSPGMFIEC